MRQAVSALALVLLLALAYSGVEDLAAASTRQCVAGRGELVVLRTPTGLVTDRRRYKGAQEGTDLYYACVRPRGSRVFVGKDDFHDPASGLGGSRLDTFQLRGRFLTFVYSTYFRYDQNTQTVEQYDLRKRRLTFKAKYSEALNGIGVERQSPELAKLVSNPSGDAAWVISTEDCSGGWCGLHAVALVAHDGSGTQTVASYQFGRGEIEYATRAREITELAITAHTVSWRHLGETQKASLR
jgi:hypothetical protein